MKRRPVDQTNKGNNASSHTEHSQPPPQKRLIFQGEMKVLEKMKDQTYQQQQHNVSKKQPGSNTRNEATQICKNMKSKPQRLLAQQKQKNNNNHNNKTNESIADYRNRDTDKDRQKPERQAQSVR